MKKNVFSEVFDDVAELNVVSDDEGIVRIKGFAILSEIHFKVSARRNDGEKDLPIDGKPPKHKYLYTGTVSLISPTGSVLISERRKREKEAAGLVYGKDFKAKDVYASKPFYCNSADPGVIAAELRSRVDQLLSENEEQYISIHMKYMTPDKLTPQLASSKYVDDFLALAYVSSPPDRNAARKRAIQRIFSGLRNVPLCKLKQSDITGLIEKGHITDDDVALCHLFWEYLIEHNRCSGKNRFPVSVARDLSAEAEDRSMFTSKEVSESVFAEMYRLINKKLSTINCGVVLLLSGFTLNDICHLKWREIAFVKGYKDFAIIHIRKEHVAVAKHDYSRPALPDTALYLRRVYDTLCEKFGADAVQDWFVVSTEGSHNEPVESKDIVEEANNILVRAGYVGRLSVAGRPGQNEPIPSALLRTNYQRMLKLRAGLVNDPDTYSFLAGIQYKSSTYINYESHTSPEAQYRLYSFLKCLSVEKKLRKTPVLRETKNGLVYTATPNTNLEVAQMAGTIWLEAGEKVVVCCPHGVTGRIEID